MFVVSSGGRSNLPSGTRSSMPANFVVVGIGSKNHFFSSGSLELVNGIIYVTIPWFLDLWIQAMREIPLHIGRWFKVYTVFWRTLPSLPDFCYFINILIFKGHSSFLSSQLLQTCIDSNKQTKKQINEFCDTMLHLFTCGVNSLVRIKAM